MFNVTYITVNNKRITVTVEADNINDAITQVSKHPDYDMLVEVEEE